MWFMCFMWFLCSRGRGASLGHRRPAPYLPLVNASRYRIYPQGYAQKAALPYLPPLTRHSISRTWSPTRAPVYHSKAVMPREKRMRRAAAGAGARPRPGGVRRGGAAGPAFSSSSSCPRLPVLPVPPPAPRGSRCRRGLPRPWLAGPRGVAEPWRSGGRRSAGLARRRRRRAPGTSDSFWKVPGARGGGSGGDLALASAGARCGCRGLSALGHRPRPARALGRPGRAAHGACGVSGLPPRGARNGAPTPFPSPCVRVHAWFHVFVCVVCVCACVSHYRHAWGVESGSGRKRSGQWFVFFFWPYKLLIYFFL